MFNKARLGIVRWPVDLPDLDNVDVATGEVPTVRVPVEYQIYTRTELRDRRNQALGNVAASVHGITSRLQAGEKFDVNAELDAEFKKQAEAEDASVAELRSRIKGWGLRFKLDDGSDGGEVPCTPEYLDAVLEQTPWYEALRDGLTAASRGARAKNSSPGPAGTPEPAQNSKASASGATNPASSTT